MDPIIGKVSYGKAVLHEADVKGKGNDKGVI